MKCLAVREEKQDMMVRHDNESPSGVERVSVCAGRPESAIMRFVISRYLACEDIGCDVRQVG